MDLLPPAPHRAEKEKPPPPVAPLIPPKHQLLGKQQNNRTPAALPQRSIMFQHRPNLERMLGLDKRISYGTTSTYPDTGDVNNLVAERLDNLTASFTHPKKQRHFIPPELAKSAQEGAAFYAAYASGNVPAMLTVTGLSLTGGTLRQGLGAVAKIFRGSNRDSSHTKHYTHHLE
jgi:hypothetical protein